MPAPNAKLRKKVVGYARPAPQAEAPARETQSRAERETWAELMRLTFGLDVLACPRCGGRMRHIATILDARVARRILEHLHLPRARSAAAAAAPPAAILAGRGRLGVSLVECCHGRFEGLCGAAASRRPARYRWTVRLHRCWKCTAFVAPAARPSGRSRRGLG